MATELQTIVDGLNDEPFSMKLNLISFDAISNEQLLQILSDVLLWIEGLAAIDIREEGADVTALRLFNSFRILKYPPPADNEKLQQWRRSIVEGEKKVIYPILEWIFKNVDVLKERAYLAKYLTRIDVPGAFQDPEVIELSNKISNLMEEFKDIHSQVTEARKDSLMMENIRADLNSMRMEKEKLSKRTDKIERKLHGVANIERLLQLAEKCRQENERLEKIEHLKLEQKNLISFSDQKLQRLNISLEEVNTVGRNVDPTKRMKALEQEIETNRYMVHEKLPKEIEAKKAIVVDLKKIVDITDIGEKDIDELQQKIEEKSQEITSLINERNRKDENTEKLSIYRHQASNVYKKKANLVEKLQEARLELQNITNMVEIKKNNLKEKRGTDFVITTTQFKNYVNKLRMKSLDYKRRQAEISDLKNEHTVLSYTADIIRNQWNILKQKIEENGRRVIERYDLSNCKKFEIVKPETDDMQKLQDMINELNQQVEMKKTIIDVLKQSNTELNKHIINATEGFNLKKQNFQIAEESFQSTFAELSENVRNMEEEIVTKKRKICYAEIELEMMKNISVKMKQDGLKFINQIKEEIHHVEQEIQVLQHSNPKNELSTEEPTAQVAMWRSLAKIFQLKLQIVEGKSKNGTFRNSEM